MTLPASGSRVKDGSVRSVERALELLFRLAAHADGAGLQQLATESGCTKSTVHRLLATLQGLGVVEQDARSRQYRLGPRAGELAGAGLDVRRVALPVMRALRDETQETVTLHLLDGDSHVVVEQLESPHEIRRILPMGEPAPLLTGATARAMLAALPSDAAHQVLARTAPEPSTGRPSDEDLALVRLQGFAFTPGERIAGGSAMSAAIADRRGRLHGAISVSGPKFRFTLARANRHAPALVAAALRISQALA